MLLSASSAQSGSCGPTTNAFPATTPTVIGTIACQCAKRKVRESTVEVAHAGKMPPMMVTRVVFVVRIV